VVLLSLGYGLHDCRTGFESWEEPEFLPISTEFLPNIGPISLPQWKRSAVSSRVKRPGQDVTQNTHLYTVSKVKKYWTSSTSKMTPEAIGRSVSATYFLVVSLVVVFSINLFGIIIVVIIILRRRRRRRRRRRKRSRYILRELYNRNVAYVESKRKMIPVII
jgi:hypothetical protein